MVVQRAFTEWLEYQEVQEKGREGMAELKQEVKKQERWTAPEKEWIKLNTDAALDQQTNRAGWGVAARD